jgi:uncharacterized membrane protein
MISSLAILLVLIGSLIGAFGAVLLKKGSDKKSLINTALLLGLGLYALSTIPYIIALKMEKLSVLYPFASLSYIWVCMLSIKLLKEKMSPLKWLGIVTIIVGVSLIGVGG